MLAGDADDVFYKVNNQVFRRMFEGNLQLRVEEAEALDKLLALAAQNNIQFKDPVYAWLTQLDARVLAAVLAGEEVRGARRAKSGDRARPVEERVLPAAADPRGGEAAGRLG